MTSAETELYRAIVGFILVIIVFLLSSALNTLELAGY